MGRFRSDRLVELRTARGLSQEQLAKLTGSTQPSINRLESGETERPRNLIELARQLGTTPEYLLGEVDDPALRLTDKRIPWRGPGEEPRSDQDMVQIHQIDLSFGLGAAIMDTEIFEDHAEKLEFPRSWLRLLTNSPPSQLCWARCKGDSMYPTIGDGDVILMDRGQQTPRDLDLIWAASYGTSAIVKRLRPMPDGSIKIISDNPNVPPETAYDGELSVFGRVIVVVKRL